MAICVPGKRQSNQIGEIAAVIVAAESFPIFYLLRIITDSKYVIDRLTMHLPKWEDNGWIGVKKRQVPSKESHLPPAKMHSRNKIHVGQRPQRQQRQQRKQQPCKRMRKK